MKTMLWQWRLVSRRDLVGQVQISHAASLTCLAQAHQGTSNSAAPNSALGPWLFSLVVWFAQHPWAFLEVLPEARGPSPTTSNSQCERRLRVVSDELRVGFVGMVFVVLRRIRPIFNGKDFAMRFFPKKRIVTIVNLHSRKQTNMNTVALRGHLERHFYLSLPTRWCVNMCFFILQVTRRTLFQHSLS